MVEEKKNEITIGIEGVMSPKNKCNDDNCPWHGNLKARGRMFNGVVKSDRMAKTVVVEWPRVVRINKFKRYMKKRTRVVAHNPDCIKARTGDKVIIMECRPLSKTKRFVVLEAKKQ